jgi:xanthine/uracil permease
MGTAYDIVSVALFLCVVVAFLFLTDRQPGTVSRLLVSGVAIAVGNQLGNAGQGLLAAALMVAGCVYAFIIVHAHSVPKA